MYYRRKILFALLQVFDDKLDKISLQKLLFLFCQQQSEKSFYFVPYKFGCYSFQANADLNTLVKYGLIMEAGVNWKKADTKDYLKEIKFIDKSAILYIKAQFGKYSKDELVNYTYKTYPYFAINSTIAENVLNPSELIEVKNHRPSFKDTVLFTIGYEGVTLEEYLNKLIVNGIRVLCDVRKNSLSMKYGFSKCQLQKACQGIGIEYVHIPDVGIDSDKRKDLHTQSDYDNLFTYYKMNVLKTEILKLQEILLLLKDKKRIALTCFESNIHQCH